MRFHRPHTPKRDREIHRDGLLRSLFLKSVMNPAEKVHSREKRELLVGGNVEAFFLSVKWSDR